MLRVKNRGFYLAISFVFISQTLGSNQSLAQNVPNCQIEGGLYSDNQPIKTSSLPEINSPHIRAEHLSTAKNPFYNESLHIAELMKEKGISFRGFLHIVPRSGRATYTGRSRELKYQNPYYNQMRQILGNSNFSRIISDEAGLATLLYTGAEVYGRERNLSEILGAVDSQPDMEKDKLLANELSKLLISSIPGADPTLLTSKSVLNAFTLFHQKHVIDQHSDKAQRVSKNINLLASSARDPSGEQYRLIELTYENHSIATANGIATDSLNYSSHEQSIGFLSEKLDDLGINVSGNTHLSASNSKRISENDKKVNLLRSAIQALKRRLDIRDLEEARIQMKKDALINLRADARLIEQGFLSAMFLTKDKTAKAAFQSAAVLGKYLYKLHEDIEVVNQIGSMNPGSFQKTYNMTAKAAKLNLATTLLSIPGLISNIMSFFGPSTDELILKDLKFLKKQVTEIRKDIESLREFISQNFKEIHKNLATLKRQQKEILADTGYIREVVDKLDNKISQEIYRKQDAQFIADYNSRSEELIELDEVTGRAYRDGDKDQVENYTRRVIRRTLEDVPPSNIFHQEINYSTNPEKGHLFRIGQSVFPAQLANLTATHLNGTNSQSGRTLAKPEIGLAPVGEIKPNNVNTQSDPKHPENLLNIRSLYSASGMAQTLPKRQSNKNREDNNSYLDKVVQGITEKEATLSRRGRETLTEVFENNSKLETLLRLYEHQVLSLEQTMNCLGKNAKAHLGKRVNTSITDSVFSSSNSIKGIWENSGDSHPVLKNFVFHQSHDMRDQIFNGNFRSRLSQQPVNQNQEFSQQIDTLMNRALELAGHSFKDIRAPKSPNPENPEFSRNSVSVIPSIAVNEKPKSGPDGYKKTEVFFTGVNSDLHKTPLRVPFELVSKYLTDIEKLVIELHPEQLNFEIVGTRHEEIDIQNAGSVDITKAIPNSSKRKKESMQYGQKRFYRTFTLAIKLFDQEIAWIDIRLDLLKGGEDHRIYPSERELEKKGISITKKEDRDLRFKGKTPSLQTQLNKSAISVWNQAVDKGSFDEFATVDVHSAGKPEHVFLSKSRLIDYLELSHSMFYELIASSIDNEMSNFDRICVKSYDSHKCDFSGSNYNYVETTTELDSLARALGLDNAIECSWEEYKSQLRETLATYALIDKTLKSLAEYKLPTHGNKRDSNAIKRDQELRMTLAGLRNEIFSSEPGRGLHTPQEIGVWYRSAQNEAAVFAKKARDQLHEIYRNNPESLADGTHEIDLTWNMSGFENVSPYLASRKNNTRMLSLARNVSRRINRGVKEIVGVNLLSDVVVDAVFPKTYSDVKPKLIQEYYKTVRQRPDVQTVYDEFEKFERRFPSSDTAK